MLGGWNGQLTKALEIKNSPTKKWSWIGDKWSELRTPANHQLSFQSLSLRLTFTLRLSSKRLNVA
jgi:hypothetical protein